VNFWHTLLNSIFNSVNIVMMTWFFTITGVIQTLLLFDIWRKVRRK
jgi:hypothetical protein